MTEGLAITLIAGVIGFCLGIFGAAIGIQNSRRLARGLPNLVDDKGWNIIDWTCLVAWLAAPVFAISVWSVTGLWWPSIAGLAVFWGSNASMSIIRYSKKVNTSTTVQTQGVSH